MNLKSVLSMPGNLPLKRLKALKLQASNRVQVYIFPGFQIQNIFSFSSVILKTVSLT